MNNDISVFSVLKLAGYDANDGMTGYDLGCLAY
jgi:hypothetical protein